MARDVRAAVLHAMRCLDAEATARALAYPRLIAAIDAMLRAGCEVPARQRHEVGGELVTLVMPAWQPGRYLGVKTVNIAAGNALLGLPALSSTYVLYDARTGVALMCPDGDTITARRTAAVAALAADRLACADAHRLLVVGAGRVARELPAAFGAMRAIDEVAVWARRPAAAQALVRELQADGIGAHAVDDLAAAAARADIVSCATLACEPLIRGGWLCPGSHLDLIGGFGPTMREADDACFAGAEVWVDTREAIAKSGDLLHPIAAGVLAAGDIRGTLADLCDRPRAARGRIARTVFKAVGSALADLAAAILVHESV